MWRLLLVALFIGCAHRTPPPANATQEASLVSPGAAKIGDRTWCIVSGEEFTATASSPKVEYGGKTYYFCCAGCDTDFAAAPEKYLGRAHAR